MVGMFIHMKIKMEYVQREGVRVKDVGNGDTEKERNSTYAE